MNFFNDSCYLVVSFPEVEWVVAQKICQSMAAQLSSISSIEEQRLVSVLYGTECLNSHIFFTRFIASILKGNQNYNPNSFYWLGAEYKRSEKTMDWIDGTQVKTSSYKGWHFDEDRESKYQSGKLCLALQWKVSSSPMIPSNFHWSYHKCYSSGGYVCKKKQNDFVRMQNQTITGVEGRITSPNYPSSYSPNLNYWIKIVAPVKFRIIVQFQKLAIEENSCCCYDYVSIQDKDFYDDFQSKTTNDSKEDRNDNVGKKTYLLNQSVQTEINTYALSEDSPSFQPYVRLCGKHENDMTKFDFVSKSNEIYFNFFSDHSTSGEGFSAIWRSVDISVCTSQTVISHKYDGYLSSPNFPHFILHNLNCTYIIQAPTGRRVWIEFIQFDIVRDAEVVLDLGEDNVLKPFRDANNIADGVFLSRKNKLKIFLQTGANPRGRGFNISFRTSNQF